MNHLWIKNRSNDKILSRNFSNNNAFTRIPQFKTLKTIIYFVICIPEIFNTNISHQFFDYTITILTFNNH